MVDLDVITKVLRKFLTAPRDPKYLEKPEYAHLKERNKEVYLSSCWYKHHWSYKRFLSYFNSMMKGSKYFVCGLPYQIAIKENLLDEAQVLDEMSEDDFDTVAWDIEMGCLWYGESEKAYFKFEDLEKNRKIPQAMYPSDYYSFIKDANFKLPSKKAGEIRLISNDIAVMAGKENDASVYTVYSLIPNGNYFNRNIVYMESVTGGNTVTQAIRIRQLFEDFACDYIVLDTMNIGTGIYDNMVLPLYDKERGIEYEPITCVNDDEMARRCAYTNARKVIYSIKGSAKLNSEIATNFRDALRRGKVRLLINEMDGKEILKKYKGYDVLAPELQAKLLTPYVQTTALVNEMINLEADFSSVGLVKLKESSTGRKDRYSSASYGNYVANILERELLQKEEEIYEDDDDIIYF